MQLLHNEEGWFFYSQAYLHIHDRYVSEMTVNNITDSDKYMSVPF
jgi:hypothetical protein